MVDNLTGRQQQSTLRGNASARHKSSDPKGSHSQRSNFPLKIDISDITPEIAAQVVRSYLLPMFEKDSRKLTKEKRQSDMNSPKRAGSEAADASVSNTVYGELKLSEKLSLEMISLRQEKEQMKERIEFLEL